MLDDHGMVDDIAVLGILTVMFAVAVLFVYACDRIIGPDVEMQRADATSEDESVAA